MSASPEMNPVLSTNPQKAFSRLGIPCLLLLLLAYAASAAVTIYPAPKEADLSRDYAVTVDGQPVDVYRGVVREDYTRSYGGPYSFAYFDLRARAEVKVTALNKPLDHVVILPESKGVTPKVGGDTLTFTLDKPCQLSIEPDSKNGPLLLFVNPPEQNAPKPDDARYKYFGPGWHEAGAIQLLVFENVRRYGSLVTRESPEVEVLGPVRNVRFVGNPVVKVDLPNNSSNTIIGAEAPAKGAGMTADSPVQFPKEGALPAKYPPDVKVQSEPAEKDYFIFSSPCRSLAQIAAIQKEMPPGQFSAPLPDWTPLQRTRRISHCDEQTLRWRYPNRAAHRHGHIHHEPLHHSAVDPLRLKIRGRVGTRKQQTSTACSTLEQAPETIQSPAPFRKMI
jgi:hypothetical protein